ncbi:MAG: putative Ig domain-containing protein [Planctomycetes bacterium]|nr:putative Ig domain-containing protein [Planctomycetota bacterium]
MKSRFIGFLGLLALLLMGAQTLSAAFDTTGATFNFTSTGQVGQLSVDVDFGGTAHSEVFFIELTTTETGYYEFCDCTGASMATNMTEWNLANPFDFSQTPVTAQTLQYTTPSLSGVHKFIFWVQILAAPVVSPASVTLRMHNLAAAGTSTLGWVNNLIGAANYGTAPGTTASTYVTDGYVECWGVLRTIENLQFDFSVNLGTAASTSISMRHWTIPPGQGQTTGSGTVIYELHALSDTGGYGTPSLTITGDTTLNVDGCINFSTTLQGVQTFRVKILPQTGATATLHTHAQVTFASGSIPGTTPPAPVPPSATPLTITPGGQSISTSTTLTASGGTTPTTYAWSITSGTAASLSAPTGTTSNLVPSGTGSVTVRLTNGSEWIEETYTITTGGGGGSPTITGPSSIPDGVENVAYGPVTIVATGGTPPYTWSATGLPTGVSIAPGTGVISGTPTVNGTFPSIVVTVTDSAAQNDVQNYSITIAPAGSVIISTTALPGGQVPNAYSQNVVAVGGAAPYAWSITAGNLPTGLTLGSSTSATVAISGNASAAGTFNFTIRVDENGGNFATRALSITIAPASGGGIGNGGGGGGGGGCASSTSSGAWWLLAVGVVGGVALYRRRKTA